MKRKTKLITRNMMNQINSKALFLVIIASTLLTARVVYSATVWSDDFDDKNIDDWETELLDWDLIDAFTGETVEFDLSDGTLKCPGETPGNIWYLATHESTVEYGKWSFDVNIVDTPDEHFYVFLMTDDWPDYPAQAYSYDLIFITGEGDPEPDSKGGIILYKRAGYQALWYDIGAWGSTEEILGWHHIEVTRDTDGAFDVYLDDEHIIDGEDTDPKSGVFTTFRFEAPSGPEIDNIVIEDSIVEEPEPEPEEESTGGSIPGFPMWSLFLGLATASYFLSTWKK